jgi:MoxR-like ATPase
VLVELLKLAPDAVVPLEPLAHGSRRCHVFDEDSLGAVNAAIAAERPLLVCGEPGLGKSQLAEAIAAAQDRPFLSCTVDSRTEHRELLWRFDAIRRLGHAQRGGSDRGITERHFVRPGPLWWALNWQSAVTKIEESVQALGDEALGEDDQPLRYGGNEAKARSGKGWVLLIDEIDKAESDVPNGLLEVLGSLRFTPYATSEPIVASSPAPLIVITTNRERTLPSAFVRRCLVLSLEMPKTERALIDFLVERGRSQFIDLGNQSPSTDESILRLAAEQLWTDRSRAFEERLNSIPGQAEYLDLIRVVVRTHPNDLNAQKLLLERSSKYLFRKRVDA